MKKKISFKLFCTVLGRGIWQALCWVGRLFSLKGTSGFTKVVKGIILSSMAILAMLITLGCGLDLYDELNYRYERHKRISEDKLYSDDNYRNDKVSQLLGKNLTYVWFENGGKPGYVVDPTTGNVLLEDIVWLVESQYGDSLAVYKTGKDKRGYINRFTGEVTEPLYDKAWIFSEGLASVMKNNEIYFIDHQGNKVFDKTFPYPTTTDGYCFYGGYCIIENDEGQVGIIDKSGAWVVEPLYQEITNRDNKFWVVSDGENTGVLNSEMKFILPVEYHEVYFDNRGEYGIFASKDGERKLYGFDGKVKENMILFGVEKLYYNTGEVDYDNEPIRCESECFWYNLGAGYTGLMDKNGKPLTKAIYNDIKAITKNTFLCEMTGGECVILNQFGKPVH